MKKFFLPLMFALLVISINAQDKGMHFEHNTTWDKVLAKAKKENKYVFVDCFTTWCGPCKMMSAEIFPDEKVGEYYNAKFVNIEVQMDKTPKDNEEVKKWYSNAYLFETKYEVHNYPTYLIFDPKGEIVHRFVGSMGEDEFLARGNDVVMPEKQYYTQLRKYRAGERSTPFLYRLAVMSQEARDMKNAKMISDEYLATQNDLYNKQNLRLIVDLTYSSKDKGFAVMLKNPDKVDSILGTKVAEMIVKGIIYKEEITPKIYPNHVLTNITPNWTALQREVAAKYPTMATNILADAKVSYYKEKADWNNFAQAVIEYLKTSGSKVSPSQLNDFAWTVFQNCNDMACIDNALTWSKKSFEKDNNHQFIDTYANLLMKAGKKQEAIEWETKAVAIAKEKKDPQVGEYEETLNTMKQKPMEQSKQVSPIKEPD